MFVCLFVASSLFAGDIWVSHYHGADHNSSSTTSAPYKTISHAVSNAWPGAEIHIDASGAYEEQVVIHDKNDLKLTAWATSWGATPTICGTHTVPAGVNEAGLIDIKHSKNITIDGLRVIESTRAGIRIANESSTTDTRHIYILNCEIGDCGESGVVARRVGAAAAPRSIYIRDNKIHDVCTLKALGEAVSISGCSVFRVERNEIYNHYKEGIDAKFGAYAGKISGNYIHSPNPNVGVNANSAGIYVDAFGLHSRNIQIDSNVVIGTRQGIALDSEVPGGILERISIFNNVVHDTHGFKSNGDLDERPNITVGGQKPDIHFKKIWIYNNTLVCGVANVKLTRTEDSSFEDMLIKNNVMDDVSDTEFFGNGRSFILLLDPIAPLGIWTPADLANAGVITNNFFCQYAISGSFQSSNYRFMHGDAYHEEMDPDFVNKQYADFHLGQNSEALDLVTAGSHPEPSFGIENGLIPVNASGVSRSTPNFDMGAFER